MAKRKRPRKTPTKKEAKRGIRRLVDRDFPGETKLSDALRQIKGISFSLANALTLLFEEKYGLSPETQLADIPEETLESLQSDLFQVHNLGLPPFLLNRRKDWATGKDLHLISTDIDTTVRFDVERKKEIWSWQGYRHAYGQKVRGQRTKSTGRTGRTVGVVRKKK